VICPAWGREPTKAAYRAFDDDGSLEFEFFLTRELGWRSVAAMRAGMSADEFLHWSIFYGREAQRRQLARAMRS
jgi:hypothetical protein